MTDVKDLYRYPGDVDAYGFDWGQLSVTLGPKVNGAAQFSAAVVTVPPGQGHARHNHPGSEEVGPGKSVLRMRPKRYTTTRRLNLDTPTYPYPRPRD